LILGIPEFLIQIGLAYSRKKSQGAKAQPQRMDTVLCWPNDFGYRNLQKIAESGMFLSLTGGNKLVLSGS